jgi:hypothetical protein
MSTLKEMKIDQIMKRFSSCLNKVSNFLHFAADNIFHHSLSFLYVTKSQLKLFMKLKKNKICAGDIQFRWKRLQLLVTKQQ